MALDPNESADPNAMSRTWTEAAFNNELRDEALKLARCHARLSIQSGSDPAMIAVAYALIAIAEKN